MKNRFMQQAIELSLENVRSGKGGPFAAVIVRGDEVIARGTNRVTSTNDPTAHAEIVAIREACQKLRDFRLQDCDIYTTCEPCPMCIGAIYWARLRRIFYANTREDAARIGFDDAFIYDQLELPSNHRQIPITQTMREEALLAFREWDAKPDKIVY